MRRRESTPARWILAALPLLLAGLVTAVGTSGCGGGKRAPVVVIGLDGADYGVLLPWIERGDLPNLAAFLEDAAVGELTTVYPILSPVCWTSAVTGVNPGKHGIFDFQKTDPAGGDPLIETATHRRATPIWMLLSDAKYRVGVLNVPMTWPPDPVRGKMVSGFPFPSGDVNIAYPPELHAELGEYPIDFLGLNLFQRTQEEMYADFLKGQRARARVAGEWIDSGRYDFIWMVFTGPDKVQHFFWKDMDAEHPRHDPETARKFGEAILDLWKKQDAVLGELLARLPEEATVVLLSDHGFHPIYRQMNMANWIPQTDLPEWLAGHAIPPMNITNGILHYQLEGQLTGETDRDPFLEKFFGLCRGVRDPKTGQNPFESLFRREELYSGRMVTKAPDIVFHETPGYFVTRGVPDSTDIPVFQDVWTTSFSAHHRPEGILAMKGPNLGGRSSGSLRARLQGGGDFDRAHIMDVTPTLLALMNEVIPDDVDGRVLDEALDREFLAAHPPRIREVEGFLLERLPPSDLTPEERERMKALPYIQ